MKMHIKSKYNLIICYSLESKRCEFNFNINNKNGRNGEKNTREKKIENLISLYYFREMAVKWLHPSFLVIFFSTIEVHTSRHMRGI